MSSLPTSTSSSPSLNSTSVADRQQKKIEDEGQYDRSSAAVDILNLAVKEIFVYRVPPMKTSSGHRAEEWKLDQPLFTGCLRVYRGDTDVKVRVYSFIDTGSQNNTTDSNIKLFAECQFEVKPGETITPYVDSVIDSSRYFVLRIKDIKSTKVAYIGIGFRDRDIAIDFRATLNDYIRYMSRMEEALVGTSHSHANAGDSSSHNPGFACETADNDADDDEGTASSSNDNSNSNTGGGAVGSVGSLLSDLSIKDGQKIKINVKGKYSLGSSSSSSSGGGDGKGGISSNSSNIVFNFPISSSSSSTTKHLPTTITNAGTNTNTASTTTNSTGGGGGGLNGSADDEDWGDFQ